MFLWCVCVCVELDQTHHLCPCRVGAAHTSPGAPNNPLCRDERMLSWKFINLLKLGCREIEQMALPPKPWLSKGVLSAVAPVWALSLPCRFEHMGKVGFPWSFPFLIWLSVKSTRGFAVLVPTGEVQVLGAVFHQQCPSAGDRLDSAAAQVAPTNAFPGILSLRSLIAVGIWAWSLLKSAGNFPSEVCVVGITSATQECRVGHVWGSAEGSLTRIQRSLRVQDLS